MLSEKGVQKFHIDDGSSPNLRSSGGSVFFFFACKSFGGLAANLATLPDNLPFFLMPSTFSALLKPFIAANQSKGLM